MEIEDERRVKGTGTCPLDPLNKYWNPTKNPIMPHKVKTFGPEINKLLKK